MQANLLDMTVINQNVQIYFLSKSNLVFRLILMHFTRKTILFCKIWILRGNNPLQSSDLPVINFSKGQPDMIFL